MREPATLRPTREWYQNIFSRLSSDAAEPQVARVVFLALEGLFLMRVNGLDDEMDWDAFLQDVEAFMPRQVN